MKVRKNDKRPLIEMDDHFIETIENNPVALATVNEDGEPYVIAVVHVKTHNDRIVITPVYMNKTIEHILHNSSVSLAVWNANWEGYQINGSAEYFDHGEWYEFVRNLKENNNTVCKGAVVVEIHDIRKIA